MNASFVLSIEDDIGTLAIKLNTSAESFRQQFLVGFEPRIFWLVSKRLITRPSDLVSN